MEIRFLGASQTVTDLKHLLTVEGKNILIIYGQVPSNPNFVEKANQAIQFISQELPDCCKKGLVQFTKAGDTT